MMRRCFKYCLLLTVLSVVSSCIENDIPYPRSFGKITAFEVQGQIGVSVIDTTKMTVSLIVSDTVYLPQTRLLRMEISDNATSVPEPTEFIDLSLPFTYTLSTYPKQEYNWSIIATQKIDRFIKADNQVGEAEFNVDEKLAILYVSNTQSLTSVKITDIQLGPSNSTISPDPRKVSDYSSLRYFTVSYRGVKETWTINVIKKEANVTTNTPDVWAKFAFLSGSYSSSAGDEPTFKYRKSSDSEWKTIPTSDVTVVGSNFSACLKGLSPDTGYEYQAVTGNSSGSTVSFTTESATQMMNMSFDDWILSNESWFPNLDLGPNYWWDSGNKGANVLGKANPTSPEEVFVIKGKAARMESVLVAGLALAGGNVFSGQYVKTSGLGAQVDFGRPFTSRPPQLTGYYCYTPKTINKTSSAYSHFKGRPDRCRIFIYVTEWDTPYRVDTNAKIYLDENDPQVIGFGELVDSVGTNGEYKKFAVDIVYRDTRKPKYCAVVAVASYYADFFTGGVGSLMFADEFSFNYDAEVKWKE